MTCEKKESSIKMVVNIIFNVYGRLMLETWSIHINRVGLRGTENVLKLQMTFNSHTKIIVNIKYAMLRNQYANYYLIMKRILFFTPMFKMYNVIFFLQII